MRALGLRLLLTPGCWAQPVAPGTLVIDNGNIVAAGPDAQVAVPPGAERIDAAGRVIMPRIVDTHSHAGSKPSRSPQPASSASTAAPAPSKKARTRMSYYTMATVAGGALVRNGR